MSTPLTFKISSALKDIIGRDLITDDFIAVFELVKNAYDAYATRVDITFENIYSGNGRIIIKDNGKGMNYEDLVNKWLFVAYSAKRDGTEDQEFDYRDNIYTNRPFAGAKGIGRFSCDRLGKRLLLETTKKEKNASTEILITDWKQFEGNLQEEFVDIQVQHESIGKNSQNLSHGTILTIEELRGDWDRQKYLKLKDSLAKLINPNRGKDENTFRIFIRIDEELETDKNYSGQYEKVNGEVKNFIFETLGLKTTKIISSVSNDGKSITTTLLDGGTLVYKIKEKNQFDLLKNTDYTLYYLNMSAKLTFTRRMGLSSSRYGHIFLYKNGFRIYPYGEPGEDPLKIDVRKAQGYNRFLGTRELIGQIETYQDTDELKETSSRGDGLIKTATYRQLEACFWEVLIRLEKYVVGVQRWGDSIEDENGQDLNKRITDFIAKLSGAKNIEEFEYSDNFLNFIEDSKTKSVEKVIKNLSKIAFESGNDQLLRETQKAAQKLAEIQQARIEAELEAERQRQQLREGEIELEETISENLFLKSIKSQDFDEIVSFMHHIGLSTTNIENEIAGTYKFLSDGGKLPREELLKIFEFISLEMRKILSITRFATKANFKLYAESQQLDLINYLQEYLANIVRPNRIDDIKIIVEIKSPSPFETKFRPLEMNIIIDNFISNAIKAYSKTVNIIIENNLMELLIYIQNDGEVIKENDRNKIFNMGFTTTTGSGLGLFHVKKLIRDMKGELTLESLNPVRFKIKFIKQGL